MKYLKELQSKKVFTLSDVAALTGNINTAKSLMRSYKKSGYVASIKKNYYAALDLVSGNAIANRYEIGTGATGTAYITHHSAMEFHGVANQVFFEVTICTTEKMRGFEFGEITYISTKTHFADGVVVPPRNPLIRVTNIERTVIDCIKDIESAGGLEEVLECIRLIPQLDENLLLYYLSCYDQKSLWQRAGFILEKYQELFGFTGAFFDRCKNEMGIRKNYLSEGNDIAYNPEWKLYAPKDLQNFLSEGDDVFV